MDKSQLRTEARHRRRGLAPAERAAAQRAVADTIEHQRTSRHWRRIAAYAGFASELNLAMWFARAAPETALFLPEIDPAGHMRFLRWSPGEPLVEGPFGIAQPPASSAAVDVAVLDAMLLPLLGFDRHGTRLGSGAGFYDRALAPLAGARQRPQLVGIAFAAQQFETLPREGWDVPLDAVITENGWLDLPA